MKPTPPDVAEALAAAICDRWQEICEFPKRWPTTPEIERATFRSMVAHALAAGRRGERSREQIAQALCAGFWAECEARGVRPWPWATMGENKRDVFRLVGDRLVEAGGELRSARRLAA